MAYLARLPYVAIRKLINAEVCMLYCTINCKCMATVDIYGMFCLVIDSVETTLLFC